MLVWRIGCVCVTFFLSGCAIPNREAREGPDQGSESDTGPPEGTTLPWDEARIRGVDFRAIGQEPGWHLEVFEGLRMVLVTGYGSDTLVTGAPEVDTTREGITTYDAATDGIAVRVQVRREECQDVMSGARFESTVTVWVDEHEYAGCGRLLNYEGDDT